MITLGVSEARAKLAKLVDEVDVRFEKLFITKNGKARAVLISSEEYESWVETLASYQDQETRNRNKELQSIKKSELLTLEQLKIKIT